MAFPLAVIALILIVVALRGTEGDLGTALVTDGPGFLKWAAAIILIGLIGYIPTLQTPSRLLLALVILVIALVNGGVFENLASALTSPPQPSTAPAAVVTQPLGAAPVQLSGAGTGTSVANPAGATGAQIGATVGSNFGPAGSVAGALLGGLF